MQDFLSNTGKERTCRVGPKSAAEVYHAYTHVLEEEEEEQMVKELRECQVQRQPCPNDNDNTDKASSSVLQGYSSSPEWSSQSDSKPAALDTTTLTSPPFPAVDNNEMQLAIQRRQLQYQESQKKPAAVDKNTMNDDLVDLTQGFDSDTENYNNNDNVGFSQQSTETMWGSCRRKHLRLEIHLQFVRTRQQLQLLLKKAILLWAMMMMMRNHCIFGCSVSIKHDKRWNLASSRSDSRHRNNVDPNNNKTSVKQTDVIEID